MVKAEGAKGVGGECICAGVEMLRFVYTRNVLRPIILQLIKKRETNDKR